LQKTKAKKGGVANVAIKHTSPINLGSPMAKAKEVNNLPVSGEQSPCIPKKVSLSQLLDVKAKTTIQEEFVNKIEGRKSLIENFNKKILKESGRCNQGSFCIIILPFKEKCVNVIETTPTPIPHHQYKTIKLLVLNVQPYLLYNHMFHCGYIVLVFCYCTYHA
jgi:hypothetical protein